MAQQANKFHAPISSLSLPSSRHVGVTQRWGQVGEHIPRMGIAWEESHV